MVNLDGTGRGAGYFTFIEGIPGPFFSECARVKQQQFFTFTTALFSTIPVPNGNVTALPSISSGQLLCLSKPNPTWQLE